VALCVLFLLGAPHVSIAQTSVTTNRNDLARTGANLSEATLNTTNVNVTQFGKLFERAVDDEVYAQPLYVSDVNIPGVGVRNVIYVATTSNSVYAFDADNPAATAPLWRVSFINPPQIVPVRRTDVGQTCGTYLDFSNNIGIVGTPVIDPVAQTIYFVVRTKESGVFRQRLHALDIRNGNPRPNSPTLIQATATGTGAGSVGGIITFDSRTQNQRAGLMLLNGVIYIAWASHCDQPPYQGWVLGYDASNLSQVMSLNVAPDGAEAGIWQSGQALSADALGNIYAITGNGTVDAHLGGRNYGSSFIKISPAGQILDWFTPYNFGFLNTIDGDLSTGVVLIPNTNLVIGAGKQGVVYVLNRDDLGQFHNGSDNQIVQSFQGSTAGSINGSPVYWNTPSNGPVIYLWPGGDPLKAYRLVNGRFQTTPIGQSPALAPPRMPGGIMSLSAFDSAPGTGILWATMSNDGDANNATQAGILRAYDANDVTRELWNSRQNATRDDFGNFAKFNPPTIANGKVYVGTFSNKVVIYGLLDGGPNNQPPVVNAGVDQTITLPSTAALAGTATDDGNPNPPGALSASWTKISGPGTVTFSPVTALTTTATFSIAGSYVVRLGVCDGGACASDDVTVTVLPAPATGTGLRAQYFNDAGDGNYFTTSVLSRVDATVDFNWSGSPATGVQSDNFSVQWLGQVQPATTGNYIFSTESNDGVRLWVNDTLVIDNWTEHATAIDNTVPIAMTANSLYNIRLEVFDRVGVAVARLMWTPPGGTSQIIPQIRLFPAPPLNQPPLVNAGADRTISLPNTVQLTGTVSDDGQPNPPGALTYTWSKISGREGSDNPVVFSNPNALTTTVTFPDSDIYVLRLSVFDGAVTVSDDITVTVNPAPNGGGTGLLGQYYNDPGGASRFVTFVLSRTDSTIDFNWGEGAPGPGLQIDNFSVRWTGKVQAVVSGSYVFSTSSDDGVRLWVGGQLVIDDWVNHAETLRSSVPITLQAGQLYDIRLEFFDADEDAIVRLMWTYPGQAQIVIPQSQLYPPSGPSNQAPVVSAGTDRAVTLPSGAALSGTANDDGLPAPPGTLTLTWSKASGPGTVTFTPPNAASSTATFSTAGTYLLRLTASDGALSVFDEMTVVVSPAPIVNQAPVVNAGPDTAIALPASATLIGTASDDGLPNPPSILTTTWSMVTGPGTVTFGNSNAQATTATFSTGGVYTLRLTASDSVLSSSDDITITVNASGGTGTGLTGQYYGNVSLGPLRLTRTDPMVDFSWTGSPGGSVPTDNFSVRWTGQILVPVTGAYVFTTVSNDGVRLWVNNQQVIDNWTDHSLTTDSSAPINLTAGVSYDVRLEYYDRSGTATIRLLWSYPGQAQVPVPQSVLFPPGTNLAPTANAGPDQTIALPGTATLAGTASDDGRPTPPGTLTTTWSRLSGPGTVTFGNASLLITTGSFSAPGTYVIRLSVFDGALTTTDDATITVNPSGPVNQAPNVNAGVDQTITLPATAVLTGTASDDGLPVPPGLLTNTWSKVSGPGTVNFSTTLEGTTVSFSTAGTYVLRLTAFDGALTTTDDVTVTVNPAVPVNQAPTVNAGSDQTITLPASASLSGTANDDGLPAPPATLTTTWSRVSGPGTVTFGNANALSTSASFSVAGTYVLRLTAFDGALTTTDDLTVTVNPAVPVNQAPTVNAGSDQTITLPASASLSGTATDDGLPAPPATLTTTWSRVSGPGTVTFGNANALSTSASFSVAGTYVLRLTAFDSALTSTDDVTVTVNSAGAGSGLTGQYFNGINFQTLRLTRVDPVVDFDWGSGAPAPSVDADNFSLRWTGQVRAPVTGNFVFTTVSDGGVRVWVNGQQVINNWADHGLATDNSAPIALTSGVSYAIVVEYRERTGTASIRLQWSYPGQSTIGIPQSQLLP